MLCLWLKRGAEKQFQALKGRGLLGDLRVETEPFSKKKFVNTHDGPSPEVLEVLNELVKRVTVSEKIVRSSNHPDGVYRHNGATLTAKIDGDPRDFQIWQLVSVRGPSVSAVDTIFELFRRGKLVPQRMIGGGASRSLPTHN